MITPTLTPPFHYLLLTAAFIIAAKFTVVVINRLKRMNQRNNIRNNKPLFSSLYTDINGFKISLDYRKQTGCNDDEYVYGEIRFDSFAQILKMASPQPNDVFYDLGCGIGKAVVASALLYNDLNAKGIEILPPLYQICESIKETFQTLPNKKTTSSIEFIQDDFFNCDFSDGNIIFINATCMSNRTWSQLCSKFHLLPKGARIIITSRALEDSRFQLIHSSMYLMSWGHSTVRIYKKVSSA